MKQLNLSKKRVSTVRLWASVLLMAIAFVFSLTPLVAIDAENESSNVENILTELKIDTKFLENYEKINVSLPKLLRSFSLISRIFSAAKAEGAQREALSVELREFLDTEKGKEALITALSFTSILTNAMGIDIFEEDAFVGQTQEETAMKTGAASFSGVITFIGLILVLATAFFAPIFFGFSLIFALIRVFTNYDAPEDVAPALSRKISSKIIMPFAMLLYLCVVPGITHAFGLTAILIITLTSILINFLASRTQCYETNSFKYVNIIQGCSLVGLIGYFIFIFNVLKTNVVSAFIKGEFGKCVGLYFHANKNGGSPENKFIIMGVLILIFAFVVFESKNYLHSTAMRLSCTERPERLGGLVGLFLPSKIRDNHIVRAAFLLLSFILPTIVLKKKYSYTDITAGMSSKDFTFLDKMSSSGESHLKIALFGIILMIAAELAIIILKKIFCSDVSYDDVQIILMGRYGEEDFTLESSEDAESADSTEAASESTNSSSSSQSGT